MLFKDIQESGLRMMLAESVQANECTNRPQIRSFRRLFGGDP
jgi:hypothetical protein